MLTLSAAALPAFAQSDRQVVEDMLLRSANVCPGHSTDRTSPTVNAVPVGALRVMLDRGLVMCPDRRLDADAPAVFYGRLGVFAWNPEVKAASTVIVKQIGSMTRNEEYPTETLVWDAKGTALTQQTVPMFEPKPGAAVMYKVR
ncbi:hypothetical protein [Xanthomonas translucens]|uniref:hypothetical protein n=1 Tax=Xanthomonas campestris pv. translucens TaxID=343 RepID=UPI00071E854F|nr:hypothetical protein [Xanthomonas translucens]KTF40132.1 hypothetical protein OZ12_08560 [Xanthomonas translucens pv. translucens]MCT8274571.1 hypothetical protein [Xanthomonas translucens pv. translucens]MCT8279092.1 hypothetical protein [Xanthomonas translucens pv. translucens]MCT8307593.1 hypothetical protein [Xanthomonas translucens pv. translucens]UII66285.1 hypothetical protein LV507_00645 [Xanthomonas translucens]